MTEVFQNKVKEKGLFYPPDPASKGSCGGNLANNSGGPKAVKYGVTRDYVINMEVVLPTGEIIWTAANVLKNSTGYNLTQLMCGSEGTLGIITKVVFKLRRQSAEDSVDDEFPSAKLMKKLAKPSRQFLQQASFHRGWNSLNAKQPRKLLITVIKY
ncbi:MAG: FAD-binding oxidoreductase [Cyclobacteriaceae bacterium]